MRKWTAILLGMVMFGLLATGLACAAKTKSVRVDESNAGKVVQLQRGDTLLVCFKENPTTGYSWTGPKPSANLTVTRDEFIPPKSQLVGAGGQHYWAFKARSKGTVSLAFRYARPWESVQPKWVTVTVKIR
ncbi:MAG: protease inhibitor I42 family protein [Solirubrobacterales bacterium]